MASYQFFVSADERIEKTVGGKKVVFRPMGVKEYIKYISKIRLFGQRLSEGQDIDDALFDSICELLSKVIVSIDGVKETITKELFHNVTLQALSDLLVSLSELITVSEKERSFR